MIRSRFDGKQKQVSNASALAVPQDEKRTKDSFAEECDVNNVVKKYKATGQLPSLVKTNPQYGDFSDVPDYLSALQTIKVAETAFQALPARVRAECANDPALFLERVQDPEWAAKHALALPKPEPTPSPAAPKAPAPAKPKGGAKPSDESDE